MAATAGYRVVLTETPTPGPGELLVELGAAGICRTDVSSARGAIVVPTGRVLGHEASGLVIGGDARRVGERVTVIPMQPCGRCVRCSEPESQPWRCTSPGRLGIDEDGVFAERFVIPSALALTLPASVSARAGAFVEPLAAAMAVLAAPLPAGSTAVMGQNRIARLVARVIGAETGHEPPCLDPGERVRARFSTVVETHGGHVDAAIDALAPGGVLVAKSRPATPVLVDWSALVQRQLTVVGVSYGPFPRAISWLAEDRLRVDDLFGRSFGLAEADEGIRAAEASEDRKLFFEPEPR